MNHAIILAGGVGSRMNADVPKQYIPVKGVPLFVYSVRKFSSRKDIDTIVIVASDDWKEFIKESLLSESISQSVVYASAGRSRQHSVWNGLQALHTIASERDLVFVHDSVRPLFPLSIIDDCIETCTEYDAALPVISVKDATYRSADGVELTAILPRTELFSGQSPECFRYGPFVRAHSMIPGDEIAFVRGCSELVFRAGMKVRLVPGTEQNFKITTKEDLQAFALLV